MHKIIISSLILLFAVSAFYSCSPLGSISADEGNIGINDADSSVIADTTQSSLEVFAENEESRSAEEETSVNEENNSYYG